MRTQAVVVRCDLCGITSDHVGERLFTAHAGFDFCRWCTSGPIQRTECGGHLVTVVDGTWSCSCGVTMAMLKMTLWRHGVSHAALAAVPDLAAATAAIHPQTPNWPQPW